MNYLDTYQIWKSKKLEDPDLIAEMSDIEGNEHEIKERFIKMLEFGTAGLRGILGVGTNRMNIYTLFYYIFARRVPLWFRFRLGADGSLDGFPVRTDQCGSDAVVEVP